MRILNRAHVPWFLFVVLATIAACWVYIGNFYPARLSPGLGLPPALVQKVSEHRSIGGTPLGLIFGVVSFAIFIFGALLSLRKKVVLWRIGTVQRWMRAHIWLTLLTIPLVLLHSGFRLGGPMTILLMALYSVVMVSGIYGLFLQHQVPRIMKERLPAETVYEQIPHIRSQLSLAAKKMCNSFKPAAPQKTDAGAPAASPTKAVMSESTPLASTAGNLSTPTARAKTAVGSTITAAPVSAAPVVGGTDPGPLAATTAPPAETSLPAKPPPPVLDPESEAALITFLEDQVMPYLNARRGSRFRLGDSGYSDDTFRFVKLRVAETYRSRVAEIQAWCDERRMLDLQTRLHHWLHGWLVVHVPFSFLLLMLTAWHAFVTLFYY
jgi:hypothetical protein